MSPGPLEALEAEIDDNIRRMFTAFRFVDRTDPKKVATAIKWAEAVSAAAKRVTIELIENCARTGT